ncbi:ABC transporter permease [Halorussus pelagicus]|uniref:ABC transporter permease n=1 Tax=Halorussus pelagicus TaxID=2505977 RepID=UPI000FFC4926|nr:ABC transporter permease [Halorussus pelagicus]
MSVQLLAWKEFTDSMRSRGLWVATAILTVVTSAAVFLPSVALNDVDPATLPQYMLAPVATFVTITALVTGYLAIAGERDTGSIRMLLGLPYTRRDVVVGKYLGRAVVVSVAILISYLVTSVVGFAVYGALPLGPYALLAVLTVVLGIAIVGIAVAISAASGNRNRAMSMAVGVFFVFELLWNIIAQGIYFVVTFGDLPGTTVPAWFVLVKRLSPTNAFKSAANLFLSNNATRVNVSQGQGATSGGSNVGPTLAERIGGEVPFYLDEWFSLIILACWVVLPIIVGYLQFKRADLG